MGCSNYDNLDSVSSVLVQSPENKVQLLGKLSCDGVGVSSGSPRSRKESHVLHLAKPFLRPEPLGVLGPVWHHFPSFFLFGWGFFFLFFSPHSFEKTSDMVYLHPRPLFIPHDAHTLPHSSPPQDCLQQDHIHTLAQSDDLLCCLVLRTP